MPRRQWQVPTCRLIASSLEDSASLPDPHIIAQEIADGLRSALAQIEDILGDLEQRVGKGALEETS